jgi:hypothetical protein
VTDFRDTNVKIAELLQQQTYDERMEMAQWLVSVLNDIKADMGNEEGFSADDIARLVGSWAEDVEAADIEADQP